MKAKNFLVIIAVILASVLVVLFSCCSSSLRASKASKEEALSITVPISQANDSIAEGMEFSERFLVGTVYYIGSYDDEYSLAAYHLKMALCEKDSEKTVQAAREVLIYAKNQEEKGIELYKDFIAGLEARGRLARSGVTLDNIKECSDTTLLEKARIIRFSDGSLCFTYCGDELSGIGKHYNPKILDINYLKWNIKSCRDRLAMCQEREDDVVKELNLVLRDGTSPLLEVLYGWLQPKSTGAGS